MADEGRIYHTPAGDFTHAQLRDRVEVVEPGIVLFRELPGGDADNFRAELEIVKEHGEAMGDYVVIIDLSEATRPGAGLLEVLFDAMRNVGIHWCAIQTSKSKVMKAVVEFVLRRASRGTATTVHDSREEAVAKARSVLAARCAAD